MMAAATVGTEDSSAPLSSLTSTASSRRAASMHCGSGKGAIILAVCGFNGRRFRMIIKK